MIWRYYSSLGLKESLCYRCSQSSCTAYY